jgi:two-component sensor histidine kinase
LLFILSILQSNASDIDSLKKSLPYLQSQKLVDTYLLIGRLGFEKNSAIDSLMLFSEKAFTKSKEIKYVPGIINSLTYLGIAHSIKGDYVTSNKCWLQALQLATLIKDYVSIADLEGKIGYNYHNLSNFNMALQHYFKAAEIMEDQHYYISLTTTYGNIAGLFESQHQYEECLFYLRKSLALINKLKEPHDRMLVYSMVTIEMVEIGQTDPRYLDSALIYAMKGLPIALENKYQQKIGTFCLQLSRIYSLKGYKKKANEYFLKAKEYRGYMTQHFILLYYLRATDHYIDEKNFPMALSFIDSTYESLRIEKNNFFGIEISKRAYEINKKIGNYKNALIAHEELRAYETITFTKEQSNQVNKLQQKFNKVQNEKTIAQLNQEKQLLSKNQQIDRLKINILAIGAALLIVIVLLVIFIYRQRTIKQKKVVLETELRLNRSRMNPHFFFNALTSIQSLSLKENKSKEVSFYISKFSKIMRSSLESTYTELSTIEEELEFLQQYLDIQKFYSDDKFTFRFEVDEDIEPSEYYIPPMILQPFIENSIEHGFRHITTGGNIRVQIQKDQQDIKITITDNGSGFKENEKHTSYPSRATQIIKDRLFLLNKKYKTNARYLLKNLVDNPGMQVIIHLPIISEK